MNKLMITNAAPTSDQVRLLTGIFVGLLAGCGTMLLFAPRSGEDTRAHLAQKSIELHDRTTETFDELVVLSRYDHRKILAATRG